VPIYKLQSGERQFEFELNWARPTGRLPARSHSTSQGPSSNVPIMPMRHRSPHQPGAADRRGAYATPPPRAAIKPSLPVSSPLSLSPLFPTVNMAQISPVSSLATASLDEPVRPQLRRTLALLCGWVLEPEDSRRQLELCFRCCLDQTPVGAMPEYADSIIFGFKPSHTVTGSSSSCSMVPSHRRPPETRRPPHATAECW
jgi:hypothetical protein